MKLAYFGNKLSKHARSKSVMETLEPLFMEFCTVKSYSDVRSQPLRLLHMVYGFFASGLRADLIMIDVYSTKNFYFAYIISVLAIFFQRPFILFLHGGNLPERYIRSRKLVNFMLKKAKKIVAPSDYLKSFFEDTGFNVLLIPNLIDIKKFPFRRRGFSKPALIYVRGFGKIYNPKMTVRSVALLRNEFPDVRLAMMGSDTDGSLQEVNGLIRELGLEKNIKIYGRMTQENWIHLSEEYNIMVSNPTIDNAPVSIIEGMALGLLIISTNVGGISHLLTDEHDSILIDSDDDEGMAKAISCILKDPARCYKMQTHARMKAESFSWNNIRPQWEELLLNQEFIS